MAPDDGSTDGGDTDRTDGQPPDSDGEQATGDGPGPLGTLPRKVVAVVLLLAITVVVAYLLGIIGLPSAELVDRGDWGNVTENRTEVITTVRVNNDNPFPISLGDGLSASYRVAFNDVQLATGEKSSLSVPKGNSTIQLRTFVQNDKLPAWWVEFVRANETIGMDINGTITVNLGPSVSQSIQKEQTALTGSTPIITALSQAANGTTGTYTESVDTGEVADGTVIDGTASEDAQRVTVGYEIREGSAAWGEVTEDETTVRFAFEVHNPGDVPVPAVPEGLGAEVKMNDVEMFQGDSGTLAPESVDSDAVIQPGKTKTVVFTVDMDNEKIDEWFTSHVRRDEQTTIETQFNLEFGVDATNSTFSVPEDSPAIYDCDLQTAILVDNQTTETDCGESPVPDGTGSDGGTESDANDLTGEESVATDSVLNQSTPTDALDDTTSTDVLGDATQNDSQSATVES